MIELSTEALEKAYEAFDKDDQLSVALDAALSHELANVTDVTVSVDGNGLMFLDKVNNVTLSPQMIPLPELGISPGTYMLVRKG